MNNSIKQKFIQKKDSITWFSTNRCSTHQSAPNDKLLIISYFSLDSNLKDVTPIPPPRSKKKNRRRPLPPKPSESYESLEPEIASKDSKEPLYSSVKFPKSRTREIYEHKVKLIFHQTNAVSPPPSIKLY